MTPEEIAKAYIEPKPEYPDGWKRYDDSTPKSPAVQTTQNMATLIVLVGWWAFVGLLAYLPFVLGAPLVGWIFVIMGLLTSYNIVKPGPPPPKSKIPTSAILGASAYAGYKLGKKTEL